jgi:hypothetical protein
MSIPWGAEASTPIKKVIVVDARAAVEDFIVVPKGAWS